MLHRRNRNTETRIWQPNWKKENNKKKKRKLFSFFFSSLSIWVREKKTHCGIMKELCKCDLVCWIPFYLLLYYACVIRTRRSQFRKMFIIFYFPFHSPFRYYLSHNTALVKLLKKLGSRPIPQWLKDDLSTTS